MADCKDSKVSLQNFIAIAIVMPEYFTLSLSFIIMNSKGRFIKFIIFKLIQTLQIFRRHHLSLNPCLVNLNPNSNFDFMVFKLTEFAEFLLFLALL